MQELYQKLVYKYPRFMRVSRFLLAGGIGLIVDLGFLYLLTDVVGLWYIISAIIAFAISLCVSFVLQKHWTFGDVSHDRVRVQATSFSILSVFNVILNALILYVLVDFANIPYILGQVIASGIIAVESYFIYKTIFR